MKNILNNFPGAERDWTKQYAAIGEFIAEFEFICWEVRFLICSILQEQGLNNFSLGEIILNQRSFTADPLAICLSACIGHVLTDNEEINKLTQTFRKEFQELTKKRNDLIHATWFIGSDVDEVTFENEPSELAAEKRTPDTKGHKVTIVASSINDVKAVTEEAAKLKLKIREIRIKVMRTLYSKHDNAQN